jgi:hypothetical protein
MADRDPDAVGYGRPPRSTRFKPGQSGNPKGRPKGVQSLGAILDKALAARVSVQENGRRTQHDRATGDNPRHRQ